MIRLKDIKIRENLTEKEVLEKAIAKNKIKHEEIEKWYIYKKSIDARKKEDIYYNYTIDLELKDKKKEKRYEQVNEYKFPDINVVRRSKYTPVIVGAGPAGLFAGLILVENGIKPIILERGKPVEERIKDVEEFIKNKKFNIASNIQFGEGGAGTFSDGKLNTGNSSIYSRKVLEEFVRFGAPAEILYTAKPHIGTDNLRKIVKNIRKYIISKGGQILFNEQVTDFEIEKGKIKAVKCSKRIETDTVILAIGHSARDTFKKLYELGVEMQPKNFAVGVRIEHLQKDIDKAQYGIQTKLNLPSADYKLVYHAKNGRTCYTFCMCPGGQVIASNSEENSIVTNGMSNFARDGENANSAILVNVAVEDYFKNTPLDGMYFQEELERKAFKLGGSNYNAPVQKVEDFIENKVTKEFGKIKPTYMPGVTGANLNEILPQFVSDTLKEGLIELDKKLNGFAEKDAILTGVETRSSSPIQITREKETLNSVNVQGLYPCGEGAGYAGGIMTAAIDGIKCAIEILAKKAMVPFSSFLLIDERMRQIEKEKLKELNYNLVKVRQNCEVYSEISSHVDIFICKIGKKIIVEPTQWNNIKSQLLNQENIERGSECIKEKYPQDIRYNVCTIGKKAIHNFEYTDSKIKEELIKQGYELINTTQGYTNCSIAVIDDNSAIVTDKGLYKILQKHNIDVLYLEYEPDIKLLSDSGYSDKKGFIGGAISKIGNNIIVFGDLNKIDKNEQIRKFIEKRNLTIIDFKGLDVIDYGGVVQMY